jgi:hypothetical protein
LRRSCSRHAWAVSIVVFLAASAPAWAPANPIPGANLRTGTTRWLADAADPPSIEGYSSAVSVPPGGAISFHVSTSPPAHYRIAVYRLGWYGGAGATLLECLPSCQGELTGSPRPVPPPFGVLSEVRADWPASATLIVPVDWVSGYYLAELELTSGPQTGRVDRVPFVVREADRHSQVLAQVPVNTWQAYNGWGGKSLYAHSSAGGERAAAVSFDRPYFGGAGSQELTDWEIALVRWLERDGYDVSYQTDVDTHRDPSSLNRHRLVLTLGHDEYWSKEMRDGFETARGLGTNLGFLGANAAYWQVRYANDERTMISFKSLHDPEPVMERKTALFREIGRPECALLGVQHQGGPQNWGRADYVVTAAGAADPWAAGTGLVEGASIAHVVSVERDTVPEVGCGSPTVLFRYDAGGDTHGNAAAVRYTAASGARVFSAGTMELGWALDSYPGAFEDTARVDTRLQRFMQNAMDDLTRPAPLRSITIGSERGLTGISVERPLDPRADVEILRRLEPSAGWTSICRGDIRICFDYPPPGRVMYEAVSYDTWARSVSIVSERFVIRAHAQSRSGGELVASRARRGPTSHELVAIALPTGRARRLLNTVASARQPAWSPDGTRLAFTVGRTIVTYANGRLRRIAAGRSPAWSPDAKSIAYERGGTVRVRDLETGRERALVRGHNPSWSRLGEIAFDAAGGIWRIRPDGSDLQRVALAGTAPAWSPDGTTLAFAEAGATVGVRTVARDGGAEHVYPLRSTSPNWSPDGRWLAGSDPAGCVCIVRLRHGASPFCLQTSGRTDDAAWRPELSRAEARGTR